MPPLKHPLSRGRIILAGLILGAQILRGAEPPAVFWTSEPVRPGETVSVIGEGLGTNITVEISRVADGKTATVSAWPGKGVSAEVLEAADQAVKFVVPARLAGGIFAYRITTEGGRVTGLLNRPQIWWTQGDLGLQASPGRWVRVFGRNLGTTGQSRVRFEQAGKTREMSAAEAGDFALRLDLPADTAPGQLRLAVHNGFGGLPGWSEPVEIVVNRPPAWPTQVFNVRDSGATGDGVRDDTRFIMQAVEKATAAGGGIVYLPRGRYRVSGGLNLPRLTILRGERPELSCLAFAELTNVPNALIQGSNWFGIENLTVYAREHQHVIAGDLGDRPGAGHVFLRQVRVRADRYRGHLKEEEVDERFRTALRLSPSGGDTVRLGGENIEITGCDFYGSGRALFLSRVRGGLVAGNRFFNGRWGWYCLSGNDGLIFENNDITGADLMSTGGGLNCLDGSAFSQHVFYSSNRLSFMHGWDREAMTTDAGGGAYFGKVSRVDGVTMSLAQAPKWPGINFRGAGVFILNGHGAGQVRRVARYTNDTVELDRPWTVKPDAQSDVSLTMYQGRYLILNNTFTDTGALQLYGTSIECVVAGNRTVRAQGLRGLGLWYYGYQPSWFCQFLDNEIAEGNYYHWTSAEDAWLEIMGGTYPLYKGALNVGSVLRRNRLLGQAQIRVHGALRDALVESNLVANASCGINVSRSTTRVTLRGNRFENVVNPVLNEAAGQGR
jgi:hypothetical protein